MRTSKIMLLFVSLLLCFGLASSSLADESALSALWDSGCDLLFHTDNVTVDGEATLSLDGARFKTAQLHYVQDGFRSLYDLTLLTPRKSGIEQETGWIIVADEDGYVYVIERYNPGFYNSGHDTVQNSLLRRSFELDAIVELGSLLAAQAEPLLPEGAVTVTDGEAGRTVRVALSQDQLSPVALSALNLGFTYLSNRWFSYGHDHYRSAEEMGVFEDYVSTTSALMGGTQRWTLNSVDVSFTLDDQGRITAAEGNLQVTSSYWDGQDRTVAMDFTLTFTDYGASHVDLFNPDDYGVVSPWNDYGDEYSAASLSGEEWDALAEKSVSLLTAQGFDVPENSDWMGWSSWDGYFYIQLDPPDHEEYVLGFSEDGTLWFYQKASASWLDLNDSGVEELDEELLASGQALAVSFLKEYNPELTDYAGTPNAEMQVTDEDGDVFVTYYDAGADALFVIQVAPSLRVEYFAAGGNG